MTTAMARTIPLLATALLLALTPLGAPAQTPFATAIMYEIREGINCNPGTSTDPACAPGAKGLGVRIADASLAGGPAPFPGGISGAINGALVAEASSILSQGDWTGPAHGKLIVRDGTTVVFSGQLNLSLAILTTPPVPLAPISGKWTTVHSPLKAGGTFFGVFLLPFSCPSSFCYLELNAAGHPTGNLVPLDPTEFFGGFPLVKLVFFMFTR